MAEGAGCYGAQAFGGSTIAIAQNVTVTDPSVDTDTAGFGSYGVVSDSIDSEIGGNVTVGGDVLITGSGSLGAVTYGSTITVNGSVSSMGNGSIGAMAVIDGFITINGTLSAQNYACANIRMPHDSSDGESQSVEFVIKGKSDGVGGEGDCADYLVYTDAKHSGAGYVGAGTVYMKRNASDEKFLAKPAVVTNAVTDLTASGTTLNGSVTSSGGATVTERGFIYGTTADLALGDAGVANIAAGHGIGNFTTMLNDLEKNTVYYVRTYAVNSQGTAYGAVVSFGPISDSEGTGFPQTGEDSFAPGILLPTLGVLGGYLYLRRRNSKEI